MIQVEIRTTGRAVRKTVNEDTPLRPFLEENVPDYQLNGTIHLNGSPIVGPALDMTFAQLGATEVTYLTQVAKRDNA